ncbi:MAG: hypothetical protein H5T92_08970, partial [Synergistales bacterium]|nr:hypothetical protein [Synergistales bacterium]
MTIACSASPLALAIGRFAMKCYLSACAGLIIVFGLATSLKSAEMQSPAQVKSLRCEYRVNPLGIGTRKPRLSWIIEDNRYGAAQSAYQILVASSPELLAQDKADLWDSGKVESSEMNQIEYAGKPLQSRQTCYWKVRIWDQQGQVSQWSEPAMWSMGLLEESDKVARWIEAPCPLVHPAKGQTLDFGNCPWVWYPEQGTNPREKAPAGPRYFRKILEIPEGHTIKRARFLITADDSFELFCNGQPAGRGG